MLQTFNIEEGLFLGAVVAFVDAGIALALASYLFRRWEKIDATTKAYAFFWTLTVLTWLPQGLRYSLFTIGSSHPILFWLDIMVQTSVFFSGPLLFYYS